MSHKMSAYPQLPGWFRVLAVVYADHFNFYIYLLFFFLIHYLFQHLQRLLIPLCPHRGTGQQELRISLLKMMLLFFQKTPDRLHRADGDACLCPHALAISADVSGLSSSMRTRKPASPRCVRAFSPKMRRTASHRHFAFAAYNFLDFRIWLSRCPSRINWHRAICSALDAVWL